MQKDTRKKVSFVLFVMAVFFAGVVLAEFHSVWWMVALSGAALLISACFLVASKEEEKQDPTEKTSEILMIDRLAELFRGNEKAEKGLYIAVKKQHEDMNRATEGLLERMDMLLTAQEDAVKTMVKYNKENARQMAISEREELGKLGDRFTESLRVLQEASESIRDSYETERSDLEYIVNTLDEMKFLLKDLSDNKMDASMFVNAVPRVSPETVIPTDLMEEKVHRLPEEELPNVEPEEMVSEVEAESFVESEEMISETEAEAFDEPEEALLSDKLLPEELLPAGFFEEEPEEEVVISAAPEVTEEEVVFSAEPDVTEEPVDMFASSGVDLSDPDRPLSPEDIAALVAAASGGSASEPEPEPMVMPEIEELLPAEPEEKKEPEDAFASSGVDLSDPNRTLSADDIAALIASLGN